MEVGEYNKSLIDWPIVRYIHIEHERRPDDWQLYEAYDDYLAAHGVDRASKLDLSALTAETARLIFFLRYICVPEVMDYSLAFASSTELEDERIAVCQMLLSLDPENTKAYSAEISRLTLASAIRATIQRVDERKVYIDTEGIRRSLDKSFHDRFERYIAYTRLSSELRERMGLSDLVDRDLDAVVYISDESFGLFSGLFDELKARFISSNDYGLDSYLSVRIRHGTLSGHARSIFERLNLITRKNTTTGEYERNDVLLQQHFRFLNPENEHSADMLLRRLSREIDETIESAKKNWIQIKGPGAPDGLFNYDYSPEQYGAAFVRLIEADEFEPFVMGVFSELRDRTEYNLAIVREKIRGEMAAALSSALDDAAGGLYSLDAALRDGQLAQSFAQCRTHIHNELETVASWFQHADDRVHPDISLRLLVDTCASIVRNFHPNFELVLANQVGDRIWCEGRTVLTLVDILLILLENISKHSDGIRAQATVSARFEGEKLHLEVTNAIPVGADVAEIEAAASRLNTISCDPEPTDAGVRSEGGSGHPKLHKLLRTDLGRGADYNVHVRIDGGVVFVVSVVAGARGIAYENPSCRG